MTDDTKIKHNNTEHTDWGSYNMSFCCYSFIPTDIENYKNTDKINDKLTTDLTRHLKKLYGKRVYDWVINVEDNWQYGCDINIEIMNNTQDKKTGKWYDDLVRKELQTLDTMEVFQQTIDYIFTECIDHEQWEKA